MRFKYFLIAINLFVQIEALVRNIPFDMISVDSKLFGGRLSGSGSLLTFESRDDNESLVLEIIVILLLFFFILIFEGVSPWYFGVYLPQIEILCSISMFVEFEWFLMCN